MILAKVIGNVVATTKDDRLVGEKLLILTPLTPEGNPKGETIVAIDSLGAGNGEVVLACRGGAARLVANHENSPVDYAIVAIVDEVKVYGR
jgi:ethanolamine utilization protein EutN